MNDISPKIIKKIQTLAQIAAELRQGKDFNITRLTLIKSLCSDPDAVARFALYIAKLALKKMKEQDCPSIIKGTLTPKKRDEYRAALTKLRAIEERHREAKSEGERQLHHIAQWVLGQWEGDNRAILEVAR